MFRITFIISFVNYKLKKIKIMEDNTKIVVDAFQKSEKPLKSGEIAKITGIETKEISKIINKLKKDGIIDSPKRCYYAIKK